MNLRVVILKAKRLTNGNHKIRIAISHNSETRYFVTRFVVPSEKNLKKGVVVGVENASYVNQKLRSRMNAIYEAYDAIPNAEWYTCSQLVDLITTKIDKSQLRTFGNVADEMLRIRNTDLSEGTKKLIRASVKTFEEFAGQNYILSSLTSVVVNEYKDFMKKTKKYRDDTIRLKMQYFRQVINFAIKHNIVRYELSPFFDYKSPKSHPRRVAISLEQLRTIRDTEFDSVTLNIARDAFMLSFYLCGMNPTDFMRLDFRKDTVKFIRQKTESRRNPDNKTEFSIQPEARAIIDRYIQPDGKLHFGCHHSSNSVSHMTTRCMSIIQKKLNFENRLIFYSARKTFAQLANQLMVKDSIIAYCLGDVFLTQQNSLSYYINITPKMADDAARKVFDLVAGTQSIEDAIAE